MAEQVQHRTVWKCLVANARRQLSYPLYRHWDLVRQTLEDTKVSLAQAQAYTPGTSSLTSSAASATAMSAPPSLTFLAALPRHLTARLRRSYARAVLLFPHPTVVLYNVGRTREGPSRFSGLAGSECMRPSHVYHMWPCGTALVL